METNVVTKEIEEAADRKDDPFGIQSVDASSDGRKAVILGIYQDPDFPEMRIHYDKSGKSRLVNSNGLLSWSRLGKAFFAENDTDIYINRYDNDIVYKATFNPKTFSITSLDEVAEKSNYIKSKLRLVIDRFYSDNNHVESVLYENKHHKLLNNLVESLAKSCETKYEFYKFTALPEIRDEQRRVELYVIRQIYDWLGELAEKDGVSIDLQILKPFVDKLEKYDKHYPRRLGEKIVEEYIKTGKKGYEL